MAVQMRKLPPFLRSLSLKEKTGNHRIEHDDCGINDAKKVHKLIKRSRQCDKLTATTTLETTAVINDEESDQESKSRKTKRAKVVRQQSQQHQYQQQQQYQQNESELDNSSDNENENDVIRLLRGKKQMTRQLRSPRRSTSGDTKVKGNLNRQDAQSDAEDCLNIRMRQSKASCSRARRASGTDATDSEFDDVSATEIIRRAKRTVVGASKPEEPADFTQQLQFGLQLVKAEQERHERLIKLAAGDLNPMLKKRATKRKKALTKAARYACSGLWHRAAAKCERTPQQ